MTTVARRKWNESKWAAFAKRTSSLIYPSPLLILILGSPRFIDMCFLQALSEHPWKGGVSQARRWKRFVSLRWSQTTVLEIDRATLTRWDQDYCFFRVTPADKTWILLLPQYQIFLENKMASQKEILSMRPFSSAWTLWSLFLYQHYPPMSCRAICGSEFAWESMATADCVRIWLRTNSVISVETSTSEIRLSDACKFSAWVFRLYSRRKRFSPLTLSATPCFQHPAHSMINAEV